MLLPRRVDSTRLPKIPYYSEQRMGKSNWKNRDSRSSKAQNLYKRQKLYKTESADRSDTADGRITSSVFWAVWTMNLNTKASAFFVALGLFPAANSFGLIPVQSRVANSISCGRQEVASGINNRFLFPGATHHALRRASQSSTYPSSGLQIPKLRAAAEEAEEGKKPKREVRYTECACWVCTTNL